MKDLITSEKEKKVLFEYSELEDYELYCSTGGTTGTLGYYRHTGHYHGNKRCIFVFGSNVEGTHAGGAAAHAVSHYGAVVGCAQGLQGDSYAIVTTEGLVKMARQINKFIQFAENHPTIMFNVTEIGCGNAGYSPVQIAPLFTRALTLKNIFLPTTFWEYFWQTRYCSPEFYKYDSRWEQWRKI